MVLGLSVLLSAAYALRTISHLMADEKGIHHRPLRPYREAGDLSRGELLGATVLTVAIVAFGLLPGPLLGLINVSATHLAHHFGY